MLYLKKYLTEGLIQFTILLSLIGVQVDVDSYLSSELAPLREIILGPSSAYTQTQFHQLRGTLDGYGVHRKSAELDGFFTRRRLLSRVRSLDRLSVPSTQLDAWLVHHDADAAVSAGGQPGPAVALENGGGGPEDAGNPESSAMRGGEAEPRSNPTTPPPARTAWPPWPPGRAGAGRQRRARPRPRPHQRGHGSD
ncbi:hypothetical protein ANANG_G00297710 [Anguilla anguilla]|uniref:Uncharacterized protein n=1 Tax=Anguilla anguilla TaxID=7936 RepID=A0A9D3LMJ6_ANGAN|nr:hypothetical protein ANANG_G00297710 [Anguilla anguilla]